ncbi:hypothetical protein LCGC14_1066940 [marine sediment metagenome]|uniref:Asparagine synthetase domain-containing protein n=2 Tax=root TaxID=1 RepID=A0A831VNX3_9FLAO|nr:hypothetical protein [Pricia antarctica]
MSKALFICFRKLQNRNFKELGEAIAKRLEPDNVTATQPYIFSDKNTFTLIYNPSPTIKTDGPSLCLGMSDGSDSLFIPNSPLPDGSYALFRAGEEMAEASSDFAASRTMWYYKSEEIFMVSTSQRMAIAFFGNFELNNKACGWFLSSGTLGPGHSWDKRLQIVPPRTRLLLNRNSWEFKIEKNVNFGFNTDAETVKDAVSHKQKLIDVVQKAVESLHIIPSQWTLALSGGMDSRSLLFHLQNPELRAVTWGLKMAMNQATSDARIGKKLAKKTNVPHQYAEMDYKEGSFPTLINRFIQASEGRIDHLAGYLDGLQLWGDLSETGRGVIRGYDAFGRKPPVKNEHQVRRTCNLSITTSQTTIPEKFRITENDIPLHLSRNDGETLEDWRDRLWLQHRTPVTTAALEDIKLSYVEIVNPLLSEQVVRAVQSLPVTLRNDKKVWDTITSEMFPGIPFAKREAVQEVGEVLNLKDVEDYICDTLRNHKDSTIFPKSFLNYLIDSYGSDYQKESFRRGLRKLIKAYLPKFIENIIRANVNTGFLSNQWLATRTFMILRINEMLVEDAKIGDI